MKKKIVIALNSCLLLSILLMILLNTFAYKDKRQSFTRILQQNAIRKENVLDIKYNSYYIAGATTDQIYLGNITAPFHLLSTNFVLTDTQHLRLSTNSNETLKSKSIQVRVDSPYLFLPDGRMPGLFRGTIHERHIDRFMYDSTYFTLCEPISPSSFILRILHKGSGGFMLAKETASSPYIKLGPGLLEKQIDGMFCVDGMLHYNKQLKKLIYIYFYRNQYIVIDTNLNLEYRGQTIDTISRARVKVGRITSESSQTLAKPPAIVNKNSCVYENWLFIHSTVLGKNDSIEVFNKASVIDVYNLTTKKYKLSFYLYDHMDKKMKTFGVFGNQLIALYDHFIVSYNLSAAYFQSKRHSKPNH